MDPEEEALLADPVGRAMLVVLTPSRDRIAGFEAFADPARLAETELALPNV